MNMKHYLPEDKQKMIEQKRKAWSSLITIEETLAQDTNLEYAKLAAVELLNSLNELDKLQKKKTERKDNKEIVQMLVRDGINAELVVMFG